MATLCQPRPTRRAVWLPRDGGAGAAARGAADPCRGPARLRLRPRGRDDPESRRGAAAGHGQAPASPAPASLAPAFSPLIAAAILRLAGAAFLLASMAAPAAAGNCPPADPRLLFHNCRGPSAVELLLLPEDSGRLSTARAAEVLVVSGAYTGADTRDEGRPNPVGLFVDDGRVISPNLARMDGVLVIGPDGQPEIFHRERVPLRGRLADLTDPDQRIDFAYWAAEHGRSVMQSHLLIVDGRLDLGQQPDAPTARRRMLFIGPGGWGVYETAEAVTLFDAAYEVQQRYHPRMAINLDMGSFDYCVLVRDGVAETCGVLGPAQIDKLSNLLRFRRTGP